MLGPFLQSDLLQGHPCALDSIVTGYPGVNQRQFNIAQDCCSWQQVEALENEPDFLVSDMGQAVIIKIRNGFPGKMAKADEQLYSKPKSKKGEAPWPACSFRKAC